MEEKIIHLFTCIMSNADQAKERTYKRKKQ